MSITNENDEELMLKSEPISPSDDRTKGDIRDNNSELKKGPWSSTEDMILLEYVKKHGEGNWNSVHKLYGLSRCGKSCRLRWANHLKPDLKKSPFTEEEEQRIIELHAKMGNKWARMATELPGRTDNEIKNFWNTRAKRRQRANLPIYPPELDLGQLNETKQNSTMITTFSPGNHLHHHHIDMDQLTSFKIPQFKGLKNSPFYSEILNSIPAASSTVYPLLNLQKHPNKPVYSSMHQPSKRPRDSESFFPSLGAAVDNSIIPCGNHFQSDGSLYRSQPFVYPSFDDDDDSTSSNLLNSNSHVALNCNSNLSSSSQPNVWAMKMELPSLQSRSNWNPPPPLTSLEGVDSLIETPHCEQLQRETLSSNSGLLDAVFYESQDLINNVNQQILSGSHHMSGNMMMMDGVVSQGLYDCNDGEVYFEQFSPLGHSSPYVFSETPPMCGNPFDDPHLLQGIFVKEGRTKTNEMMNYSSQDSIIGSNCWDSFKGTTNMIDNSMLSDPMGTLFW